MKSTSERTWVGRRRANTLVSAATGTPLLPDGLLRRSYKRPSAAGKAVGGGSVDWNSRVTHFVFKDGLKDGKILIF